MTKNQRAEADAEMMLAEGIPADRVCRIVCEDYSLPYGAAVEITNHARRSVSTEAEPTK